MKKKAKGKEEKRGFMFRGIISLVHKVIFSFFNLVDRMIKKGEKEAIGTGEIKGTIGGEPAKISYRYKIKIGLPKKFKAKEAIER